MMDSGELLLQKWPRWKRDTDIHCLLPEILSYIFSYLDPADKGRAAQVCRSWREVCNRKTVWRGACARLHLKRTNPLVFSSLERRGIRRVQVLSVRKTLRDLTSLHLQSLDLTGCFNVTDALIINALEHELPLLERLILSFCKQITDTSIARVAQYARNLKVLELAGCSQVTSNALTLISVGLERLERLNVRSCKGVTDRGISYISGLQPADLEPKGNLNLTDLVLQDCQSVTDDALSHLSCLKNLDSINISFCAGITDTAFRYLAKSTSLRHLNVRSCDNVSDTGIGYLVEGGSKIETLDLAFCERLTDSCLTHISRGLFNLRALSLSACKITDEGVSNLAKSQIELRALDIGQCSKLTDASAIVLSQYLIRLKALDVYGCVSMTTVGLERLTNMADLKYFNMHLWNRAGHALTAI